MTVATRHNSFPVQFGACAIKYRQSLMEEQMRWWRSATFEGFVISLPTQNCINILVKLPDRNLDGRWIF